MNNAGRELRRRQLIQRRFRTQLNTIQNLVDDLLERLSRQNEPLSHEDTQRLRRISIILRSIYENRGTLQHYDFEDYLAYQQRDFEQYLSDTTSWHTCQSDNDST
jgi:glucan phosphorylase